MKYLVSFGVLLLLVILPLVSWYYLDTGLDYRKGLQEATIPKGEISEYGLNDSLLFKSKTTLLQIDPNIDKSTVDKLYKQFKKAGTFQLITPIDYDEHNIISTEGLILDSEKFKGKSFALIDTSMNVRNLYGSLVDSTLQDIVAQLAVTLPLKKPRDIKMKMEE